MENVRKVENPLVKYSTLFQQLIKAGSDINAADSQGTTILHLACKDGNIEIVKYLLSQGASLTNIDEEGLDALLLAAECQDLEMVQILIEARADIHYLNVRESYTKQSPVTALQVK
ncbi:hypothetical protein QAD02_009954 [Eretmocerus hayati]|uniref:Uncharacterized protein n=1 Tax=Eretmocerus hayati TaxID=131215 RepID=A0ACC2NC54_9HYME|nr:hypothetical protein QAD02_009954 [Eretmocerus hayati]